MTTRGALQHGLQALRRIRANPQVGDRHIQPAQHGGEQVTVTVVDLALGERFAGLAQFRTGGQQRHPGPAQHLDGAQPQRRQQPQVRRPQPPPGVQQPVSHGDVLTGAADVLAGARRTPEVHPGSAALPAQVTLLLHDHRVAPVGYQGTGHDAHAVPRRQRPLEGRPRRGGAGQRQSAFRRPVGAAQRVAVHGGIVRRRHRAGGEQVLSENPVQPVPQRHRLALRHGANGGKQTVAGLFKTEHRVAG